MSDTPTIENGELYGEIIAQALLAHGCKIHPESHFTTRLRTAVEKSEARDRLKEHLKDIDWNAVAGEANTVGTTPEITSVLKIAVDRILDDKPRASTVKKALKLLKSFGIDAVETTVGIYSLPGIGLDMSQDGFVENLERFQDAVKDKIIDNARLMIDSGYRGIDVLEMIPRRPDGKALDAAFAAEIITEKATVLRDTARTLGHVAEQALRDVVSPRGWTRTPQDE